MEDLVLKSRRAIDASVTPVTMATTASFPLVTKTASLTVCFFVYLFVCFFFLRFGSASLSQGSQKFRKNFLEKMKHFYFALQVKKSRSFDPKVLPFK